MLSWALNQQNTLRFVLVDETYTEVPGLGGAFTLKLCKANETEFVEGIGDKSELENGWYQYITTRDEANKQGEVAVIVTATGTIQQNLLYSVRPGSTVIPDDLPLFYAAPGDATIVGSECIIIGGLIGNGEDAGSVDYADAPSADFAPDDDVSGWYGDYASDDCY